MGWWCQAINAFGGTVKTTAIIFALAALGLSTLAASSQESLKPAIWVDPDGCEHWVIDDGAEGFMTPHVRRDGTPVCRGAGVCGVLPTDLLFETESTRVSASGRDRIAAVFQRGNARSFIVTGHTDARGSDEFNMRLGQERANAVARIGRTLGAPVSDVVSFGERRPRASNGTVAGRQANRRVEILCLN